VEDLIELRTDAWRPGKPNRRLDRALVASAWQTLVLKGECTRADFPRQMHSSAVITLLSQLPSVRQTGPQSIALREVLTIEQLDLELDDLLKDTTPPDTDGETDGDVDKDDALIARLSARHRTDTRSRQLAISQFERDSRLSQLIKRKRGHSCQVCGPQNAFPARGGHRYVETHHLDWLSDDVRDVEENILVVCAVCHRKFHHGDPPAAVRREGDDLTVILCGVGTRLTNFTVRR
jgi:hypothetical protein